MTKLHDHHILITRPKNQAEKLIDAIEKAGGKALHFPTIIIEPVNNNDTKLIENLAAYDIALFMSTNAAIFGLKCIQNNLSCVPEGIQWIAVGAATQRVLQALGLDTVCPEGKSSSEGLLMMPVFQAVNNKKVIIFKGKGGRELVEQALVTRGAKVDSVDMYQRILPDVNTMENQLQHVDQLLMTNRLRAVVVTSSEVLTNLILLTKDLPHASKLYELPFVVPSPRVADQCIQLGINCVEVIDEINDHAVVSALSKVV